MLRVTHIKNLFKGAIMALIVSLSMPLLAQEEMQPAFKNDFVSLGKPMVLNLSSNRGRLHFLQIQADVLVKSQAAKETAEIFVPLFRHILIVNLSELDALLLKDTEKREQLRTDISKQMVEKLGKMADASGVEEVLFSEFLVQ